MKLSETVKQFMDARRGMISPATKALYDYALNDLVDFLDDLDVERISLPDLRAYRGNLFDRPLSQHSIHQRIRTVKTLFRWLADEELLPRDISHRLQLPSLGNEPPKGIAESDLQKLIAAAKSSPRDLALVLFLADTGARVGGVVGLKIADLDLEHRRAVVREKGRMGQPKTRRLYFSPMTADALREWVAARNFRQDYLRYKTDAVFTGKAGAAITRHGITSILADIAERAGVEGRHNPHSFRHGLARAMIERGADLARVSRILGHSGVAVTAKFYAVFADNELQAAHDQFTWIGGKQR